jgi:hypothetical protein
MPSTASTNKLPGWRNNGPTNHKQLCQPQTTLFGWHTTNNHTILLLRQLSSAAKEIPSGDFFYFFGFFLGFN